ncbi:MAG: radical SAM protein [Candidatus Odinarchaeia archaeon]
MTELKRVPSRTGQVIYGPIHSRRIGVDIGINLLTQRGKTCNFNCVYCQYGITGNLIKEYSEVNGWVPTHEVKKQLDKALNTLLERRQSLDAVTISGYGEPTLHPYFKEISIEVKKLI